MIKNSFRYSFGKIVKTPNQIRPLKQIRLDEAFGLVVFILMVASVAYPPFRYFGYIIPPLGLIVVLANRSIHAPDLTRPYIVLLIAGVILSPKANGEGIKDLYLMLTGLSAALVGFRYHYSWRKLFLICLIGFSIYILSTSGFDIKNFRLDIMNSESSFESSFAFVFGLFAIWAVYERQWWRFAVSMVFVVLALKRIVILGVFICVIIQFIPQALSQRLLRPIPMLIANVVLLLLIMLYGSGALDQTIRELTGQSANAFGMGRRVIYTAVTAEFFKDPWQFLLIGTGPGESYDILKGGANWLSKENLHSDTLKILMEYGAIVFTIFIWSLYSSRQFIVLLFALYTNILFVTDNTLIYPFYIFFLTYIVSCISEDKPVSTARDI